MEPALAAPHRAVLPYEGVAAARDIEPPLAEIDADPDGVFWG